MRTLLLLLGLFAVFAALILAEGQIGIAEQAAHANAALAGGLYSIPLAALVRV